MVFLSIIAILIFVIGYIGITLEHTAQLHKSALALVMGASLWIIVALTGMDFEHQIMETGYDIFGITVFLLCAMSLVEILIHYGFFDIIKDKLTKRHLSTKKQFWVLTTIVFFLSAIVDNLTATIIAIQIARKFFWNRNLLVAAVAIVIAANAGGAFSPIGDITTIMLWVADKFDTLTLVSYAFLPSLLIFLSANYLLSRKIKPEAVKHEDHVAKVKLTRSEKVVIITAISSFFLPIVAKFFHLPPALGILLGVGLTWLSVDACKKLSKHKTHLSASIDNLIQKTDIASIKFFIGILLAVAALNTLGVLTSISQFLYGTGESVDRIIFGNVFTGLISSILDNIPLTAIAIKTLATTDPHLWVLLAISVGTGGSLLAIGSASGVVATGMVSGLSFKEYFKIGFVPALISFSIGIITWYGIWAVFN